MNWEKRYLTFIERLCMVTHRDSMKYRIKRYRMEGAVIGENVRAFSPISSPEAYLIKVGNNVTISTGVRFCTHDNSAIKIFDDATDFVGPITIGDRSFIGMNAILMGGVTLPEHCIVGAGSVVTKSFSEEGCVIAGNPAKIIGSIDHIRTGRENPKGIWNLIPFGFLYPQPVSPPTTSCWTSYSGIYSSLSMIAAVD